MAVLWKKNSLQDRLRSNYWHSQGAPLVSPLIAKLALYCTALCYPLKDSLNGLSYNTFTQYRRSLVKNLYNFNELFLESVTEIIDFVIYVLVKTLRIYIVFFYYKKLKAAEKPYHVYARHNSVACFAGSGLNNIFDIPLRKKWSFSLSISFVIVKKGNCWFGHIYWRNPQWETSFFVQSAHWLISFKSLFSSFLEYS